MLLRSDALAGCCIAFLAVDGVDDRPKLCSLFGQYVPVANGSFVPSLDSPLGRFLPGLETLNKWTGRREAGIVSLTLNACLLLDSGVLGSVFVFPVDCNASLRRSTRISKPPERFRPSFT